MTTTRMPATQTPDAAIAADGAGAGRLALVCGATGGLGAQVCRALVQRGWSVRAMHRQPDNARMTAGLDQVDWVRGDAMNAADLLSAARGVSVLVHAANPPGYRNWRELAIPMLANAIGAATAHDARLIFPGNVYNFDPADGELITETSVQRPVSRKGLVRQQMEQMIAQAPGLRSLVVRAGDFFGPQQPASWVRDLMIKPGKPVRSVVYPGDFMTGHAWAYLPDLADTIAQLAGIERQLPDHQTVCFGGHWIEQGADFARALARAGGCPDAPVRKAPWAAIRLAALFAAFPRELLEMRYLWQQPLRLDNRRLVALLGREPHTPLDEALRTTLAALGCPTEAMAV